MRCSQLSRQPLRGARARSCRTGPVSAHHSALSIARSVQRERANAPSQRRNAYIAGMPTYVRDALRYVAFGGSGLPSHTVRERRMKTRCRYLTARAAYLFCFAFGRTWSLHCHFEPMKTIMNLELCPAPHEGTTALGVWAKRRQKSQRKCTQSSPAAAPGATCDGGHATTRLRCL